MIGVLVCGLRSLYFSRTASAECWLVPVSVMHGSMLRMNLCTKSVCVLGSCVHIATIHMDQYILWDSHHHMGTKYSVINPLVDREKADSSTPNSLEQKKNQQWLMEVHTKCTYPAWALDRMEHKNFKQATPNNKTKSRKTITKTPSPPTTVHT